MAGVEELVQTPFVLYILVESLPELEAAKSGSAERVRRIDGFNAFVKHWFLKEEVRQSTHSCND